MALRLIHTVTNGPATCKVYRDAEWNEYRVRLFVNGKLNKAADSHTNDKQDAIDTARAMALHEKLHADLLAFHQAYPQAVLQATDELTKLLG